jgi:hypothetical protein
MLKELDEVVEEAVVVDLEVLVEEAVVVDLGVVIFPFPI